VLARNAYTADRHKARYRLFAGKKAPDGGWRGDLRARLVVRTGEGATHAVRDATVEGPR